MATKTTGKASPKTSTSEELGAGLASAYEDRMAERVERNDLLSEEQRAVLKIEEERPSDEIRQLRDSVAQSDPGLG